MACKYTYNGVEYSERDFKVMLTQQMTGKTMQGILDGVGVVMEYKRGGEKLPEGMRKKTILSRAIESEAAKNDPKMKQALKDVGEFSEVQGFEEGERIAEQFINEVGMDTAVELASTLRITGADGKPNGAACSAVLGRAVSLAWDKAQSAETEEDAMNALKEHAYILDQIEIFQHAAGAAGAYWAKYYAENDYMFNAEKAIAAWKARNGGEISPDVEKKFREYEKQIKEKNEEISRLTEENKKAQEQEFFENHDEMVRRQKESVVKLVKEGVESELAKYFEALPKKRKALAKSTIDKLKSYDRALASRAYESTLGIPVAIIRGAIHTAIGVIQITGKVADGIEAAMNQIRKEYEKQYGKKLSTEQDKKMLDELHGIVGDIKEPIDIEVNADGRPIIPHQLIRDLVEGGIRTIEELVSAVKDIISEDFPDISDREVRDAISGYGKQIKDTRDDIEKEISKLRSLGKLISALEDVREGKRAKRSGKKHRELEKQERALIKQIREASKDLPVDAETLANEQKTALDAIKRRLANEIEDLDSEIEKGEKNVKDKKVVEYDEFANLLKGIRDFVKGVNNEIFGEEVSDATKIQRAIKAIDRAIADIDAQLESGDLSYKENKKLSSPELEAARNKMKAKRESLAKAREEAGLAEKRKEEMQLKAIDRAIEMYKERIRKRDFTKKKKTTSENEKIIKALKEKEAVKEEWNKMVYENERATRSWQRKAWSSFLDGLGITRTLLSSAELSPIMVQGAFYTVNAIANSFIGIFTKRGGVRQFAESLYNTLSSLFSESRFNDLQRNITTSDYWRRAMKEDKLNLTVGNYKLEAKENENYFTRSINYLWGAAGSPLYLLDLMGIKSKLLHPMEYFRAVVMGRPMPEAIGAFERWKLANPYRAFERGATMYMNSARMSMYNDTVRMLEHQGKDRKTHPQDYKDAASIVNTLTMKTNWGEAEKLAEPLSHVFYSAKMWSSTAKLFTPYVFYTLGSKPSYSISNGEVKVGRREVSVAQKYAIKNLLTMIGLTTGVIMAFKLKNPDDDDDDWVVETDPRSSNFMTIKKGDVVVDPWGGKRTMVVLEARLTMAALQQEAYKDSHGKLFELGEYKGYKDNAPTAWNLLGKYTQGKLAPTPGLAVNLLSTRFNQQGQRVDEYGNEVSLQESIEELLYPMYVNSMFELWDEDEPLARLTLAGLGFIGVGTNVYDTKSYSNAPKAPMPPSPPKAPEAPK